MISLFCVCFYQLTFLQGMGHIFLLPQMSSNFYWIMHVVAVILLSTWCLWPLYRVLSFALTVKLLSGYLSPLEVCF